MAPHDLASAILAAPATLEQVILKHLGTLKASVPSFILFPLLSLLSSQSTASGHTVSVFVSEKGSF